MTRACRGFVYAASTMGVTGARTSVDGDARALVERTRVVTDLPVCVGLGVSTGAQAAELAAYADGVIVGSALVAHAERPRGTRRPARRVAGTDDRAGRGSEDEAMSTEMDGATPVDGRRRALGGARARARRRRHSWRGCSSASCSSSRASSRSATRSPPSAPCRPTRCFPDERRQVRSAWACPSSRSSSACCSCSACSPGRSRSPRPCSWWRSSSASRRPGRAGSPSTAAASAAGARSARTETKYPQEIARDAVFALAGAWLWWRPRTLASLDRYLFGH